MTDTDLHLLDPLTGAHNRRFLADLLGADWESLRQANGPVAVVLLDLDFFKEVNDRHGHLLGDAFLKATAERLRELVRRTDFVVRYGGDEFVLVLPGMGEPEAVRLMEAVRSSAASRALAVEAGGARLESPVRFSYGVGSSPGDGEAGEEALAAADRRLYEDKRIRQRRSALRRSLPGSAVAALALVGVVIAVLSALTISRRTSLGASEVLPLPSVSPLVLMLAATPPPETPPAVELEEILRAQIAELQRQVEQLRKEVSTRPARTREIEEVNALRDTIEQLEQQIGAVRPAPTPATAADTRPSPAVVLAQASARIPATNPTPAPSLALPSPTPAADVPGIAAAAGTAPPGHQVVPPILAHFVKPRYPSVARNLRKEAAVVVRVHVDRQGRVIGAETEGGPHGFGFDEAAIGAARAARFRPGTIDGAPAAMDAKLYVRFRLDPDRG